MVICKFLSACILLFATNIISVVLGIDCWKWCPLSGLANKQTNLKALNWFWWPILSLAWVAVAHFLQLCMWGDTKLRELLIFAWITYISFDDKKQAAKVRSILRLTHTLSFGFPQSLTCLHTKSCIYFALLSLHLTTVWQVAQCWLLLKKSAMWEKSIKANKQEWGLLPACLHSLLDNRNGSTIRFLNNLPHSSVTEFTFSFLHLDSASGIGHCWALYDLV